MRLVVESRERILKRLAGHCADVLRREPAAVLGLDSAPCLMGVYDELALLCAAGELSLAGCSAFLTGEYLAPDGSLADNCRETVEARLIGCTDLRREAFYSPKTAPGGDYSGYDAEIKAAGGVSLLLLGIAGRGRIGFNEPLTAFDSVTHVSALKSETRAELNCAANEAVTMGIRTIMQARQIVLLALGEGCAEAVKALVLGRPGIACPASLLQLHDEVTLYADEAAAGLLD